MNGPKAVASRAMVEILLALGWSLRQGKRPISEQHAIYEQSLVAAEGCNPEWWEVRVKRPVAEIEEELLERAQAGRQEEK